MNTWANTVLTDKGRSLMAKLTQGNTLNITRAVTGAGFVTPGLLTKQKGVTNPKQTLRSRSVYYPENGQCALPVALTNEEVSTGYVATQVGIYATDPDDGEILLFISQSDSAGTGTIVPSKAEMPGFSAEWTFYLRYGQADGVTVVVDPTHAVSRADMEGYVNNAIDGYKIVAQQKFTDIDVFMASAQERLDKLDGREAFYAQKDEPTDAEEGSVWLDLDEGEDGEGDTIVGGFGHLVRISEITLFAANWEGEANLYSQVVAIDGITENSQVNLTPSVDQIAIFYEKDVTFVTENDGGVVTVYAIGQKPQNDYTIQVNIVEVSV